MADEGSAQDLQHALDQTAVGMPTPPPADLDPLQPTSGTPDHNGWTGEAWEYDGSQRKAEHSPHSAAKELAYTRQKRRQAQGGDGSDPQQFVDQPTYIDGRPPDQEVSAKEAAADLTRYRKDVAAKLLQELTDEQAQPQPEAAPTPEPEPQYTPEQIEAAAAQQQIAQQWQAAQQASGDYQNLLTAGIAHLMGAGIQEFADIKTPADLSALAQRDAARFARFQQVDTQIRQVQNELGRIRQQQAETYTQNYQRFAAEHDKAVETMVPELAPTADPKVRAELQQGARELLKEAGFTDDELRHAWQNGGVFYLRDARAQKIIADASRWRIAQARLKTAIKAPHPEVQRPGVRQNPTSYSDQLIGAASKQLTSSGRFRDAVALRRAVYAQRRNG
jgi:hypothetical protein